MTPPKSTYAATEFCPFA